jgi:dipeptidase D
MNETVANLEPKSVWTCFERLNAVPRPSKKEERVRSFVENFGNDLGLEVISDTAGNIIIRKPATIGKENVTPVVLQGHLDMVHQKNADTDFDFDNQGIESYIDGDWVKAKGTTLGADNGIGAASIMAVLQSDSIAHGPIEGLFTIDEETGMTGAIHLQSGLLQGKILLNTDTEDEGELCIGCAGGVDTTATWNYEQQGATGEAYQISVTGLRGGHSGVDIHLGRANANKIINRVLASIPAIQIGQLIGGSLRNAIPREAFAKILIQPDDVAAVKQTVIQVAAIIKNERKTTEPNLTIELTATDSFSSVMQRQAQQRLIDLVAASPNGVDRMSEDIEGLVETSTNLSKVEVAEGTASVQFLTRSSVESARVELSRKIESVYRLGGAVVVHAGEYPGWKPNAESKILDHMKAVYQKLFGRPPAVSAVHAGLECGIIGSHYPDLDMISFGPTIKNPHSPDEKCHIPSVNLYWQYLVEVLQTIT